jgi:hypothetical protein
MNLVQINERLKDLPEQVIRQYANGMNPEVPPYLALGELQRRELINKQMATAQGGQQGPQPSVKEQIEQKAGLMGLQQMQQQQMAQQQSQPRGPMPAPAGVPQPEAQPEAPMMAARGGLARIPVRSDMFEYAGGGIVAFQSGGDTMGMPSSAELELAESARDIKAREEQRAKKMAELEQKVAFLAMAGAPQESAARQELEEFKTTGRVRETKPPVRSVSEAQATMKAGPQAAAPVSGVKAAAEVKAPPRPVAERPTALRPPAPQGGLPTALPARSPYFAQVNADLAKEIPKPTPQDIVAEQRALSPEAMLEESMKRRMEEQRERAAGERAAFEKTRPSGLDDLIRVFGQAGLSKGLSGVGPAYTANQQQKRDAELAMEKRQNELMTGVDTREYEGAKEVFGARTNAMKEANRSFQDRLKSRSEVLAQMAGVDQRSIDEALNRLNQMQIARMRAVEGTTAGERVTAQYLKLVAEKKPAEAEALMEAHLRATKGGEKTSPLDAAMAKQYAEAYAAALALPAGKLRDERMAGLREMEKRLKGDGGAAAEAGKVPPPPPGFKVN